MIQLILIELFKIVKRPRTYIGFLAIFLTVGAMQLAMYYEGEELISIAIQNLENDFRLEGKIINTNLMTYILLNSLECLGTDPNTWKFKLGRPVLPWSKNFFFSDTMRLRNIGK